MLPPGGSPCSIACMHDVLVSATSLHASCLLTLANDSLVTRIAYFFRAVKAHLGRILDASLEVGHILIANRHGSLERLKRSLKPPGTISGHCVGQLCQDLLKSCPPS